MNKTTLFEQHKNLGAKMVDFGGWSMPINYGSQINEHKVVRSDVGIFDVSHMSIFDLSGSEQEEFLKYLLPNDVNKIKNSGRTHAHKIQAAIAMSQRAKVASQRAKDPKKKKDLGQAHKIYQNYIDTNKKSKD